MSPPNDTRLKALIPLSYLVPRFTVLRAFFATWLKLDLTSLAAALTIYGTMSGVLKDLQGIALKIYWYFTRFFTASISIGSHDRLNKEIINWLATQILTRQDTRILTARTESIRSDAWIPQNEKTKRDDYRFEKRIPIQYLPTFGTTWFIHERNVFLVRRINARTAFAAANTPDEYAAAPEGDEPLVIMVLGRSVRPIKKFFETCRSFADEQRKAFITVRAPKNQYGRESWDTTILRPIRPLSTVHFDQIVKDELVADVENYLDPNTRRFYTGRGIPYRRGYLLDGPPGTGKTSLALALAGFFGLELYLCHIPSIREDSELERLFSTLAPSCIVLLEDIDAVGKDRRGLRDGPPSGQDEEDDSDDDDNKSFSGRSRVTLSGLLNVLDGVASQEGRIVIMTSNVSHQLDKALVRPGRIDKIIFLGNIARSSAKLMFLRMYATNDANIPAIFHIDLEQLEKLAEEFSGHVPDDVFTPAALQGYLLNHRRDPIEATKNINGWVLEEKAKLEHAKRRAKEAALRNANKRKTKALQLLARNRERIAIDEEEIENQIRQIEKDIHKKSKKEKDNKTENPADQEYAEDTGSGKDAALTREENTDDMKSLDNSEHPALEARDV